MTVEQAVFPMMVTLKNKPVTVIGGGEVATRRIKKLLQAGAKVKVISLEITEELKRLENKQEIKWFQRKYDKDLNLSNAFLVVAATNSKKVNEKIKENISKNQLINVISDYRLSNFHFPSQLNIGELTIAVSTNGSSPMLAKKIKNDLKEKYSSEYKDYLSFLKKMRKMILQFPDDKSSLKEKLLKQLTSEIYLNNIEKRKEFTRKLNDI